MNTKHGGVFTIDTKSITPEGEFVGYASVFNVIDSHKDIVTKGAYRKTLAKRPAARVKMLREHDGEPIGVWKSLVEDERGLKATGQLILGTVKGAETYELMKAGAYDSLSVGYRTVKDRMDRTKGARILEELDLWEVSVVAFGSNQQATIQSVKSKPSTQFRALIEAINSARTSLNS